MDKYYKRGVMAVAIALIAITVMCLAIYGCGGGGGKPGSILPPVIDPGKTASVKMTVKVSSSRAPSDIAKVTIKVTGNNMDDVNAVLTPDATKTTWTGSMQVPQGYDRIFVANALDASGGVLYSGFTRVEIKAGIVNNVTIDLNASAAGGMVSMTVSVPNIVTVSNSTGMCASFYIVGDPNRGDAVTDDEIRTVLTAIKPYCYKIRTFGSTKGLEHVPSIAWNEFHLYTIVGVWLGHDQAANAQEVNGAIAIAHENSDGLRGFCIGDEVLLRGDLAEGDINSPPGDGTLCGYIKQVANAVTSNNVLIGYADTYAMLLLHPSVCATVQLGHPSFLMANIYPYWEGKSIDEALGFVQDKWAQLAASYPNNKFYLGETGWPTAGDTRGSAVPSDNNAFRHYRDVMGWTQANNIDVFWFEAIDESWKAFYGEGQTGIHWGMFELIGQSLRMKEPYAQLHKRS